MNRWLLLHLVAAGFWLGCIVVEVAFERALAGDEGRRLLLAGLHRKVDLWVEVPAFLLVLVSGGVMLFKGVPVSPLLLVKIVTGVAAVAANVVCVWLVLERSRVARLADADGYASVDARQHRWGAAVLFAVVASMALGFGIAQ